MIFAVIGLVVDGGGMVHAYQRAFAISREAARTAGQEITLDNFGQVIYDHRANLAGQSYLTAHGCDSGTITITSQEITTTCHLSYDPIFLPGSYQVTGTGSANPHNVIHP